MKKENEFANFDRLMREVIKVPHNEIAAKLKAERTAKRRKKSKKSSASREAV
jgi:hypothetical protein